MVPWNEKKYYNANFFNYRVNLLSFRHILIICTSHLLLLYPWSNLIYNSLSWAVLWPCIWTIAYKGKVLLSEFGNEERKNTPLWFKRNDLGKAKIYPSPQNGKMWHKVGLMWSAIHIGQEQKLPSPRNHCHASVDIQNLFSLELWIKCYRLTLRIIIKKTDTMLWFQPDKRNVEMFKISSYICISSGIIRFVNIWCFRLHSSG